jgi:hypothetical protein
MYMYSLSSLVQINYFCVRHFAQNENLNVHELQKISESEILYTLKITMHKVRYMYLASFPVHPNITLPDSLHVMLKHLETRPCLP